MFLLNLFLWFANGLLCGAVVLVAFLNQRLKIFPIFFWLTGCYFVQFLVQFIIGDRSDTLWLWSSFLMTGVSFPLELAALYELFRKLIPPQSALARHLIPMSRKVLAFLVFGSSILAGLTPMASQVAARRALMNLWFSQDCLEVGLLASLLVLAVTLGIAWRHLHAGVLLGWGISSSCNVLGMPLLSRPGLVAATFVREAGFTACALVWLWYVLYPEPSEARSPAVLSSLSGLNREANALHAILGEQK